MYSFRFPLPALSVLSGIPVDTLRTWQRAQNRVVHCTLVELAYQRLQQEPGALRWIDADDDLPAFAAQLGFPTPYLKGVGIPTTTLRQWEKDGEGRRVRVMLLGYQTQQLEALQRDIRSTSMPCPVSPASLMRLLLADPQATKTLLRQIVAGTQE